MLEIAQLAIRMGVIPQGGPARRNGILQHRANGGCKPRGPHRPGNARRASLRREARTEQRLTHIDIAQPRHVALVEQGGLDGCLPPAQPLGEKGCGKLVPQRLRPHRQKMPARLKLCLRHEIHEAEAAVIGIDDARAVLHVEHDMVMPLAARHVVVEEAGRKPAVRGMNGEAPGHAQMHDEDFAVRPFRGLRLQMDEDIFRTAPQMPDPAARQALGETLGQGKAQIGPPLCHMPDHTALHRRREAATDGFNFGQFGHGKEVLRNSAWKVAPLAAPRYGPPMNAQAKNERPETSGKETHFGFRTVAEEEKVGLVHEVFEKVAERYDLMNDLMSGGLHRAWKQVMIDWLNPPRSERPFHLIDVAGGTGDIAFRFLDRAGPNAQVTVCDINRHMLGVGRGRAEAKAYEGRVEFACGNAEVLPFPDRSFDAYTIAFGIRNVTHIDRALKEAYRVLKPGGRFLCLEFSQVSVPGMDRIYDAYSFAAIPRMGEWVTGDGAPYQYLVESIRRFPDQETFKRMIVDAGFGRVSYRNLTGGVAALHSGWRL